MVMHMPYTNDVIQNGTEKSNEPRKTPQIIHAPPDS